MKNQNYSLNEEFYKKLDYVAEKIHNKKEELKGKLINYESLTTHYFGYDLPDDEVERLHWVNNRTKWVEELNNKFLENKYPIQLRIEFGKGVYLLPDNSAVINRIKQRTQKNANTLGKTITVYKQMLECFPDAKKLLKPCLRMAEEELFAISGRLNNSKLPLPIKKELQEIIKDKLPLDNEE